jgi:hypothetical protein
MAPMRSTKSQAPSSKQLPIFKTPILRFFSYCDLMIEVSLGFGVWDLGFLP